MSLWMDQLAAEKKARALIVAKSRARFNKARRGSLRLQAKAAGESLTKFNKFGRRKGKAMRKAMRAGGKGSRKEWLAKHPERDAAKQFNSQPVMMGGNYNFPPATSAGGERDANGTMAFPESGNSRPPAEVNIGPTAANPSGTPQAI